MKLYVKNTALVAIGFCRRIDGQLAMTCFLHDLIDIYIIKF